MISRGPWFQGPSNKESVVGVYIWFLFSETGKPVQSTYTQPVNSTVRDCRVCKHCDDAEGDADADHDADAHVADDAGDDIGHENKRE